MCDKPDYLLQALDEFVAERKRKQHQREKVYGDNVFHLEEQIKNLTTQLNELNAKLERAKMEEDSYLRCRDRREQDQYYWYINPAGQAACAKENCSLSDSRMFDDYNYFATERSANKFAQIMNEWKKGVHDNAYTGFIDIKALTPLLPPGCVVMDKNGDWYWFDEQDANNLSPDEDDGIWWSAGSNGGKKIEIFNIKPAKDWKLSLLMCGK